MPLLSMRNISKSFSGLAANRNVDLDVEAGEIHALLGENGAGKTTLMNILYGIYDRDSGFVEWRGEAVRFLSPRDAIAAGIGMVHQHFMLVPTLSVRDNVTLGLKPPGHPFPDRRRIAADIRALSRRYGMEVEPEALVSELSVGEQQRVEILKLLYRDARLLILDEPTAVLTPSETERFFSVLKCLKREGHAVILITHRIPEVLEAADRITVLRDGAKAADLPAAGADAEGLARLMIGRPLKRAARSRRRDRPGAGGVEVSGLVFRARGGAASPGLDLRVAPGEIVGVAGVDGNGQKEFAECLLGLRRAVSGSIVLDGERVERLTTAERRRRGMAYVSDDRHRDGLVLDMDLAENYYLAFHGDRRWARAGFVDRARRDGETAAAIRDYAIKANGPRSPSRLLSGGNQQKLVLARELARKPSFLVAFQPSRGLDVGAAEFVGERLLELRGSGCAVLLISADLDELLALSDRLAVMHRGALSAPMENDGGIDPTRIGLLMAGHAEGGSACAS